MTTGYTIHIGTLSNSFIGFDGLFQLWAPLLYCCIHLRSKLFKLLLSSKYLMDRPLVLPKVEDTLEDFLTNHTSLRFFRAMLDSNVP